jgi:RNA polymerase sigma-70 factor (ECF subfamily)
MSDEIRAAPGSCHVNQSCKDPPMTDQALARARAGDERAFRELTDPYRRELQVHCYRMLGSLFDAEDALQETLVSAWRGLDRFEQRASVRAWLYRIATNRCLNMLRDSRRRHRTGGPVPFEPPPATRTTELTWLEPYPDAWIEGLPDTAPGPDARYETREAVALAFITALQQLPTAQRAALVLRDVLGFRASEAAEMLDSTEAGVNSALQRGRAALEERLPPEREHTPLPESADERELANRFADAFEQGDMDRVVALLTDDAWVTMPPAPFEYQGRDTIAEFLDHVAAARVEGAVVKLVPTRANGQPAFGQYAAAPGERVATGAGVFVLTLERDRISVVTRFGGAELLPKFGLPATMELP